MPLLIALLLLLLLTPLPALAVITFDDGGVHVIDAPSDAVEVLNATTVLTVPGADVLAATGITGLVATGASTVGIFGGTVAGRNLPSPTVGCIGGVCSCSGIITFVRFNPDAPASDRHVSSAAISKSLEMLMKYSRIWPRPSNSPRPIARAS